jgi:hypothetical protein
VDLDGVRSRVLFGSFLNFGDFVMHKERLVSLETLARGAVQEAFDHELTRVLGNIVDPNTNPCAPRTITVKVVFKPDMKRETAAVTVSADSKLAANLPISTTLFIDR